MKNIFIKSMLRQPIRTALLMLLIALATGVFVLRMAEFRIISDTLHELGSRYRAVGAVRNVRSNVVVNDIRAAANVITHSPYVAFEDRRRGVEGVMHDVLNINIDGMVQRYRSQMRVTHAFFYGEIVEVSVVTDEFAWIVVRVCEVVAGYPEHIIAGQYVQIRYNATESCLAADELPVVGLTIGERYFLRAVFYGAPMSPRPRIGNEADELVLRPLNHITHPIDDEILRFGTGSGAWAFGANNELPQNPLWFMAVEPGETIDYMATGLEWLAKEILWIRHNQSGLNIRTTMDMESMPLMWDSANVIAITQGRAVDKNDYLQANPVIVIHEQLAERRGLALGDTLTIGIPRRQLRDNVIPYVGVEQSMVWDAFVVSTLDNYTGAPSDTVLELEIVGLYIFYQHWSRIQTFATELAFIPDSVLPSNHTFYRAESTAALAESYPYTYFMRIPDYQLYDVWYSFVLHDPLDRTAFLERYSEPLAAMGYALIIPETGAENFWATANPILQAITFNIIVFGAVTVLLLALVCWLFLRQRRKDFAILRALGCSGKKAFGQLIVALFVFGLPAVIIGSVVAWVIAQRQANNTLNPFEEIVHGFEPTGALAGYWLGVFVAVAFVVLLLMFVAGAVKMSRRAVLEMLQG